MPCIECPFRPSDKIVEKMRAETPVIIMDMHAEATSEKNSLAWYLDGRVSAVIGTHTHVQTSDERLLNNGTAFISDAGMVGAYDSIIGVKRDQIIKRFLLGMPERFEPEDEGPGIFNGLIIDVEPNGKASSIKRLLRHVKDMGIVKPKAN
jgi:calcineurin-like phosphoesterase